MVLPLPPPGNDGFYWLKMGEVNLKPQYWRMASIAAQIAYLTLVFFGILAAVLWLLKYKNGTSNLNRKLFPSFTYGLLLLLIYGLFFGYGRYHFPFIPFLCMYAAYGVSQMIENLQNRQSKNMDI